MKKLVITGIAFAVALSGVLFFSYSGNAGQQKTDLNSNAVRDVAPSNAAANVTAYYFHGNFRCVSCRNIEQYTKEALDEFLPNELASGKLQYKVINVEQPGNEHYVKDYQLYTKSVVLSKVIDGKESEYKNLDKVWQLLRNKEQFYVYIKDEVENFLN